MPIALALLVSDDPVTIGKFSDALEELSISSEVCQDLPTSISLLNSRKFDAVIVDLQLGGSSGVILDAAHLSASNRTAVTFVIGSRDDEAHTSEFRKRAGFAFERPLSPPSIRSTLKPAYGLILRERRRYFRCPVAIPVTIQRNNMPEVRGYTANISEGGMAVSTFIPLSNGESVRIQFTLPDHDVPFVTESKIIWWKTGHLGVRFLSFSQGRKSDLQDWLSQKLEETLPEFVAGKFRKTKVCPEPITENSEQR